MLEYVQIIVIIWVSLILGFTLGWVGCLFYIDHREQRSNRGRELEEWPYCNKLMEFKMKEDL